MNDRMSDMDALVEVAADDLMQFRWGAMGGDRHDLRVRRQIAEQEATRILEAVDLPALLERVEAAEREVARHGPCECITAGPDMQGPDEFCPKHGRPYHEVRDMGAREIVQLADDRDALAAKVARVEALADEWQRMVYDTRNPRGDTGSVRRCAEEVRAALDASETP